MKNSTLKRILLVFAILSGVFILAYVGCLVFYPMVLANGDGSAIASYLELDNKIFYQAFILPFDGAEHLQSQEFFAAYSLVSPQLPLTLSIVLYVFSSLMLIFTILAVVFVCTRKKSSLSIYAICLLIAAYIGGCMITNGGIHLASAQAAFSQTVKAIGPGIMSICIFAFGCLAFVLALTTAILGMVYANKAFKKAPQEEVEEEPKSLAEAVGDPEAVQEGEELLLASEPAVVESEPEPVSEEAPVEEETALVEEPTTAEEPAPVEEAEESKVEPEPKEDSNDNQQHVEVNVNNSAPNGSGSGIDQASLASLLREVVRDIVRDEIARNNLNQPQQQPQSQPNGNQTITGATFGGPLVVQYFNGGINGVTSPAPAPQVVQAPEEPKHVEEKKEEVKPVEEKKEEVKAEEPKVEEKPAPRPLFVKKEVVEQPKVEANPAEEPKKYERITFAERLLQSEKDVHELYNELKNEILSYGVKSRISAVGDTFRLHKKMYVRITVAGKSLKLYFALNPADYANSTIPVQDASNKDMYQEIPLVFKVKSDLSVRRCKELIQDVMEKDNLEQGEVGKVNWIKELKAELASGKKKESEED